MSLPNRIFFTGVPGSRWSGIAQTIEQVTGFNTSDRTPDREYSHGGFSGHRGAYFGQKMEFDSFLIPEYIDQAWPTRGGCKLVKSHDWAYKLELIKSLFPNDWIMLVYRPDAASYSWWFEAGGFKISYPKYDWYENHAKMLTEITIQNDNILKFAHSYNLTWSYFTEDWIAKTFSERVAVKKSWPDILVTVLK